MKEAARFFKALSDESRLKMLWLLFNRQELCVCDVMAVLEMDELATNHLKLLRTTLAKHPDAKRLLDKLNDWLKEKSRGASCLNNNAPSRTKTKGASITALLQERLHGQ
ncbi:MAG: ArsR family transcriptional regulator [Acidobacteriota bacterium]